MISSNLKRNFEIVKDKYGLDGHKRLSWSELVRKYKLSQSRLQFIVNRYTSEVLLELGKEGRAV